MDGQWASLDEIAFYSPEYDNLLMFDSFVTVLHLFIHIFYPRKKHALFCFTNGTVSVLNIITIFTLSIQTDRPKQTVQNKICNKTYQLWSTHPAGTQHQNDVVSTSMRHDHVASTLIRRHFDVVCPLGKILPVKRQLLVLILFISHLQTLSLAFLKSTVNLWPLLNPQNKFKVFG